VKGDHLGKSHHDIMKPSKVNWANSSCTKQLLENSSEREGSDASRLGFAHYYSKPKSVTRESSCKQKDRELWPWEKQRSENQRASNEGSLVKSLSNFSD
jgi:hypothetical protein